MPDGSFPIRNRSDLRNALRAIGRARNPEAARVHIEHRARQLGLTGMMPDTWGLTAAVAVDPELEAMVETVMDTAVANIELDADTKRELDAAA